MIGPYQPNSIVTGDCRELSRAIPDHSIDLIFTDPPYLKECHRYVNTITTGVDTYGSTPGQLGSMPAGDIADALK
jgi:hypothetical protein